MTDFRSKRAAALELLAQTGISSDNYAPPITRFLWALGLPMRPPHFNGYLANFLIAGFVFGGVMGALVCAVSAAFMAVGVAEPWLPLLGPASGVFSGILFGWFMASYYAEDARQYRLPRWESL